MAKKATTQKERTLEYLRTHKRGLTPLDAWQKLGVYRISAVIHELRKVGHNITTDDAIVKNRFGEECKVALYKIWE